MAVLKIKVKKTRMKRKINNVTVEGYIGRVISNGKTSFEEIARASAKNTTLHSKEAELAAELLLEGVCEQLKQGMIVDLGPLGTIYPGVKGPWHENADDLSLSDMTPKVNYKPSTDIDAAIKGASLAWTTEAETENTTTPTNTDDVTGDDQTGGDDTPNTPTGDLEG